MDVMHEEMEKMKKEMSRLDSVAKDEQWKQTIAEQQLEHKMQEGVTVSKRLTSKLPPNAFASEVPATTSRLPTSQLSPAELPKKATEKDLTSSTEQQERLNPKSATDLPVGTQILSTLANNDVANARRHGMLGPLDATSVAGEETADPTTATENVFHAAPLPENIEDDNEPDTEFALIQNRRPTVHIMHPEKVTG